MMPFLTSALNCKTMASSSGRGLISLQVIYRSLGRRKRTTATFPHTTMRLQPSTVPISHDLPVLILHFERSCVRRLSIVFFGKNINDGPSPLGQLLKQIEYRIPSCFDVLYRFQRLTIFPLHAHYNLPFEQLDGGKGAVRKMSDQSTSSTHAFQEDVRVGYFIYAHLCHIQMQFVCDATNVRPIVCLSRFFHIRSTVMNNGFDFRIDAPVRRCFVVSLQC